MGDPPSLSIILYLAVNLIYLPESEIQRFGGDAYWFELKLINLLKSSFFSQNTQYLYT